MVKVVWFLKKADDITIDQFRSWWLESHAPFIKEKQGAYLKRYIVNVRATDALPGKPAGECAWDGFAEEWFATEAEARAAFSLPSGPEGRADVMKHVSRLERLIVTEHAII
ncbi:MAG: EthD family reductase [Alphaproteobacteria bacterium]